MLLWRWFIRQIFICNCTWTKYLSWMNNNPWTWAWASYSLELCFLRVIWMSCPAPSEWLQCNEKMKGRKRQQRGKKIDCTSDRDMEVDNILTWHDVVKPLHNFTLTPNHTFVAVALEFCHNPSCRGLCKFYRVWGSLVFVEAPETSENPTQSIQNIIRRLWCYLLYSIDIFIHYYVI